MKKKILFIGVALFCLNASAYAKEKSPYARMMTWEAEGLKGSVKNVTYSSPYNTTTETVYFNSKGQLTSFTFSTSDSLTTIEYTYDSDGLFIYSDHHVDLYNNEDNKKHRNIAFKYDDKTKKLTMGSENGTIEKILLDNGKVHTFKSSEKNNDTYLRKYTYTDSGFIDTIHSQVISTDGEILMCSDVVYKYSEFDEHKNWIKGQLTPNDCNKEKSYETTETTSLIEYYK